MSELRWLVCTLLALCSLSGESLHGQAPPVLREQATQALKRAASYYRFQVARHGGYVYYCSLDLGDRWGEGKVSPDTIVVQPPATPTVGIAYLRAWEATGDRFYLDAAREAAEALVQGQLESGGWTQVIHFAPPAAGRLGKYRNRRGGSWNASSLDDGQTQTALQFLTLADQALRGAHAEIREAAHYGLDALLAAQFPNGGFPQVWTAAAPPQPVLPARYPDHDWRSAGKLKNYWDYYTLNDNLAAGVAETLITAHRVYQDERYEIALRKLGEFLILAQMPAPQPGWCQQYNYQMVPIWARKFEPPAVAGWESQGAMETLIAIARQTGDRRYLAPIPAALAYFRERCLLPDGRVARYYELRTNQPLYMDAEYRLTYDDSAAPSHYGWKQPARFDDIERAWRNALGGDPVAPAAAASPGEEEVRQIIGSLDAEGRWVSRYGDERLVGQPEFERGFPYLSSEVFAGNVEALSAYLAQTSH